MRPIYETEADKARELGVVEYLQRKGYKFLYTETVPFAPFDGYMTRPDGTTFALVEIKNRRNASDAYPTYMISANKVRAMLETAKEYQLHALLFVRFTDGVFVTRLEDNEQTGEGGRYDRNDSRDIEECVYIPMERFKEL